jgi:hypothetical protein
MSSELEQRLQRALAEVVPGESAGEQAREAALAAVPHSIRRRHRLVLALAAVVAVLVLAGAALAASRTAREAVGLADHGTSTTRNHLKPAGLLPPGSSGFAAFGGDRLWLASPGLKTAGRRFSAVELSPGALNMAVGSGHNLKVLRLSDGSVAWSHPAGGQVAAAAWAPIGTEIAYVVRSGRIYQLRMIEGDGDHDHLLANDVLPVKPSWRSDSLAIAYANARHQVTVDDFTSGRTTVVGRPADCPVVDASSVAFAPRGPLLAASIGDGNMLLANPGSGWAACAAPAGFVMGPLAPAQFAWISGSALLAASDQYLARLTVDGRRIMVSSPITAPAGIGGLAVSPDERQLAIGLIHQFRVQLVSASIPKAGDRTLSISRILRSLPNPQSFMRPVIVSVPAPPTWYTLIWR